MSHPALTYEIEVIKDGKVIKKIEDTSKSFVKNFAIFLRWFIETTNQYTYLTDENNGVATLYPSLLAGHLNSRGGQIGIGNGSTPPSPTDYRLENLIDRKKATVEPLIVESDKCRFSMYADFSFTEDKTIQEFGIFVNYAGIQQVLIVRDVLSEPITLPAGATLRVRYNWIFPI